MTAPVRRQHAGLYNKSLGWKLIWGWTL